MRSEDVRLAILTRRLVDADRNGLKNGDVERELNDYLRVSEVKVLQSIALSMFPPLGKNARYHSNQRHCLDCYSNSIGSRFFNDRQRTEEINRS